MPNGEPKKAVFTGKRRIELLRRVLEVLLLLGLGHIIRQGDAQNTGKIWAKGEVTGSCQLKHLSDSDRICD